MTAATRWIGSHLRGVACIAFLAGCGLLLLHHVASTVPAASDPDGSEASPRPKKGRWRPARAVDTPAGEADGGDRELVALPYLGGYHEAPDRSGVTIHDEKRSYPGLNFYTSGHAVESGIMDMDGNVLHRWSNDAGDLLEPLRRSENPDYLETLTHWRRARFYENGDLLAIFGNQLLIRVNKDSELVWASEVHEPHHHLQVDGNGRIYVLSRRLRSTPELGTREELLDDLISVLNPEGEVIEEHSLYDAFRSSAYSSVLRGLRAEGEVFHTNTVQVFDGSLADVSPLYRKGNVLVAILYLNMIAIVNLERNRVVWALDGHETGLWHGMHEPAVLDDGNMLIFDNNWREAGVVSKSRVVEFNPFTREVVWMYQGDKAHPFYSMTCGTCQRLPNGNTLITETDDGRAFEVTKDNEIVWEYISPYRAGERGELIASLFEMERVEPDRVRWLTRSRGEK